MLQSLIALILSLFTGFFSLFGLGGKTQTWNVTETNVKALSLTEYNYSMTTENSVGTVKTRTFAGVRLKDFLAAKGIDVQALPSNATVTVKTSDNYPSPTYSRSTILDNRTLIAWKEDGASIPLRLCPGSLRDANLYVQNVKSITLKYTPGAAEAPEDIIEVSFLLPSNTAA